MRRMLRLLAVVLTVGIFGGAGIVPANAAAFLWIAAGNWSYSAAACATPGAAFYAWFLAVGAGATTAAWTACSGPFGGSASFAVAKAGVGGAGAAFAGGFADPYAGLSVDTSLTGLSNSSTYQGDSTNGSAFNSEPSYTLNGGDTALTLNLSGVDLSAVEQLTAFQYTGDTTQSGLCSLLGGSGCGSQSSNQAGDVTNLSTLETDLGLGTPLGTLSDPTSGSSLPFTSTYGGS